MVNFVSIVEDRNVERGDWEKRLVIVETKSGKHTERQTDKE
jgi:hypothetical protein